MRRRRHVRTTASAIEATSSSVSTALAQAVASTVEVCSRSHQDGTWSSHSGDRAAARGLDRLSETSELVGPVVALGEERAERVLGHRDAAHARDGPSERTGRRLSRGGSVLG